MALYAHAHEVRPLKPLLPSLWCLQGLAVMHLAGQSWLALALFVELCLASVPTRLELCFAGHPPSLGPIEGRILGVPSLVVFLVVFLRPECCLALLCLDSFRLYYRRTVLAVCRPVGYHALAAWAWFHVHGCRSCSLSSRPPTCASLSYAGRLKIKKEKRKDPTPLGPGLHNINIALFNVPFHAIFLRGGTGGTAGTRFYI